VADVVKPKVEVAGTELAPEIDALIACGAAATERKLEVSA